MTIAKGGQNPCRREFDTAFGKTFVTRMLHSGRNYSRIVMLGQFLIAVVKHGIVSSVARHAGFKVVRYKKPCDTAKVIVSMNMTAELILQLHIIADFNVGVTSARQYGDEKIRI